MLAALKARLAAQRGAAAEQQAEAHLCGKGLHPVARNWRCPLGELDLVMREGDTLVIIEVRARSGADYGGALASVTAAKRRKLVRAAQAFVQAHAEWQDASIRFDLVLFEANTPAQWLKNAFDLDDLA